MNDYIRITTLLLLLTLSIPAFADFTLTKKAIPTSIIVLQEDADPATKHAASELALFLGKISGGKAPEIAKSTKKGVYPVFFSLVKDPKIAPEGFALSANAKGLRIEANKPIGLIYGAYEILKKYGGIRWLVPGEEGEFFTPKPTIAVPEMPRRIHNPSFPVRSLHFNTANIDSPKFEVIDWMLRNNMRFQEGSAFLNLKRRGVAEFIAKRDPIICEGWSCFTRLHSGIITAPDRKKCLADYRKMYEEHPERFPLINGKRMFLQGQDYQPCTSNPDNIKIMTKNLIAHIRQSEMDKKEARFIILNNDNTSWCECVDCKALDDPREAQENIVSTRFWKFVNTLAENVYKEIPNAPLTGYAYQNYQTVPLGVKPDPRLDIMLSFNRICYRHNLDDPNCPTNKVFLDLFKDWSKLKKGIITWEEIGPNGYSYMPLETTLINHLEVYKKLGMGGTIPSVAPLHAIYTRMKNPLMPVSWYGMWQALYLLAQFEWDIDSNYDALLEEANQLYYGKAWKNGMKDFRALIAKTAATTPGCFGWGHDTPIGRCLTQPGVHAKLREYLDKAEEAVKDDPRRLANVRRDRMLFAETWEKAHEQYVKNYRELRAYPKTAAIKIDGVIEEPDWKNADIVSNFKVKSGQMAEIQTFARVVYEPDALYLAVEAMEPTPEKMLCNITQRDGKVWEDNVVELFINHPDMGASYFHFIVNSNGVLYDAKVTPGAMTHDVAFDGNAEWKTKISKGCWCLEMRIPTSSLGMKCFPGHTWRMNIVRVRNIKGEKAITSSIALGAAHGVETFLPVAFVAKRTLRNVSFQEKDTRYWSNANLNEVEKKTKFPPGWTVKNGLVPKAWYLAHSAKGVLSMELHPGSENNYFLRTSQSRIYQLHKGKQKKFRINLTVRGKGTFAVYAYRYTRTPEGNSGKGLGADLILQKKIDSDQWENFSADYEKKDANEVLAFALHAIGEGEICFDDIFVSPMDMEK